MLSSLKGSFDFSGNHTEVSLGVSFVRGALDAIGLPRPATCHV